MDAKKFLNFKVDAFFQLNSGSLLPADLSILGVLMETIGKGQGLKRGGLV